jgi:diaminohydroxyphosphoribosylaminopyrimidine deaminase/5-amino-6-(5-phosphoribosylamino)uracil reductase
LDRKLKEKLFRRAAALALTARPSPNPRVGAILVKNGKVIAEGFHRMAGEDHAEAAALKKAGSRAAGAELVVTLEPCHTTGRTPPCTDAIVAAGVRRVHVGTLDPNPAENGRGVEALRAAGIDVIVEEGPTEALCRRLIEEWALFITRHVPFVRIKAAVSLDGRIATAAGDSRWISSEASRKEVHRLRARHDAILVGLDTVVRDDPMLTVRGVSWKGPPPWRIVADTHLRIPVRSKLVRTAAQVPTFIACGANEKKEDLKRHGVQTLHCSIADGRVDLADLVGKLGRLSVTSVLVEGGSEIITSLIEKRLADAVTLYICPMIVGGKHAVPLVKGSGVEAIRDALRVRDVRWRKRGDEIVFSGRLK